MRWVSAFSGGDAPKAPNLNEEFNNEKSSAELLRASPQARQIACSEEAEFERSEDRLHRSIMNKRVCTTDLLFPLYMGWSNNAKEILVQKLLFSPLFVAQRVHPAKALLRHVCLAPKHCACQDSRLETWCCTDYSNPITIHVPSRSSRNAGSVLFSRALLSTPCLVRFKHWEGATCRSATACQEGKRVSEVMPFWGGRFGAYWPQELSLPSLRGNLMSCLNLVI